MFPEPNYGETRLRNAGCAPLGRDYNNGVTLVLRLLDLTRCVDQLRECDVASSLSVKLVVTIAKVAVDFAVFPQLRRSQCPDRGCAVRQLRPDMRSCRRGRMVEQWSGKPLTSE